MPEVRERLELLADEGAPRGASNVFRRAHAELHDAPFVDRPRARSRRPATSALGALVLVLALIGGASAMVRALSGHDGRTRADTELRYLLPATVPPGFAIVRTTEAAATAPPPPAPFTRTQRWASFASDGRPLAVIDVQWGQPQSGSAAGGDPLAQYRAGGEPMTIRGHDGLASAGDGWIVWQEQADLVVFVTGKTVPAYGQNAPALPMPELVAVATTLARRADGGFDVTAAPAGFVRLAEWPDNGYEGVHARAALYAGPRGAAFQVQLVDATQAPPGSSVLFDGDRRVDVNGATGVLSQFVTTPPVVVLDGAPLFSGASRYLQWIDSAGTRITISARQVDDATLLAIARSMAPVDAATWRSHEGSGTPPTTLQPTTTLSPATTAPPPPGAHHFEGTFQGIEHYTLQTKRCAQLDHDLTETYHVTNGETWTFENLYCGTITDTNLWTGVGTFLFTTPHGTFGGDTYSVARVPSSGGAVPLTITRGTGAYADARGSCLLDDHIRQVAFGVQDQSGTFTCEIASGPTPTTTQPTTP